ncbi:flavodoxin family protein, partial [Vibrio parahaemolyticus]|nr:flavodoxin family protein [Vibrio parahaemolyticus]
MLEVLALFARFKINNEKGTIVAKIAIIYFSKTDVTGQLARAIAA